MARKVKEAVGVLSEAFKTALSWAFCAVALYAVLFANLTGNGALWDSLRTVLMNAQSAPSPFPKLEVVQTRRVPARPVDAETKAQEKLLMIPGEPVQEFSVPVLAPAQSPGPAAPRPASAARAAR